MASCERCWRDAQWVLFSGDGDISTEYRRLITERNGECTPEQQAGDDATDCDKCGRRTRHQHCRICMACGDDPRATEKQS
jgi:ribosomal protein L37E